MELNYSPSLVTFICIHIIIIHMIFIHLSSQTQASDQNLDNVNYYEISEKNKEVIIEQVKANLLKVLGLKEVPRPPRNKAFVPHAILEEYRKTRDLVRDTIPEDRDFYGKINIDDLENNHEDFWNAVYNKYGGYDIEVDMGRDDENKRFHYKGDAKQIAYVGPQSEPEDVPPNVEPLLPPHSRSTQSQKQFISVHLRFNLSQELFINPMAADELKGAELHLFRERIFDCEFNDRRPMPFFDRNASSNKQNVETVTSSNYNNNSGGSSTSSKDSEDRRDSSLTNKKLRNRPRYQRVYILHIFDYDKHNEPITSIHESQRIDTLQTTPLVFDIYKIIKFWLKNPTKNYGIIVRVTNDDKEYERQVEQQQQSTSSAINLKDSTNASSDNIFKQKVMGVEEHVRLKREFRFVSESDESWIRKQPSILIFSNPPVAAKHLVKRDHSAGEIENMQADEPEASTSDYTNINPVQSNQTSEDSQISGEGQTQTSKQNVGSTSRHRHTNGNRPVSRRDRQTNNVNQYNRNVGAGTASSQNHRVKGKGKPARTGKCGRKTLEIKFNDVGWSNWIIAPQSYNADYCTGECSFPMSDQQNATNHAIIQSIFHSAGRLVPKSCCAPTKLSSMAILYQLDGVVQMKHYDDMIVESCGCL